MVGHEAAAGFEVGGVVVVVVVVVIPQPLPAFPTPHAAPPKSPPFPDAVASDVLPGAEADDALRLEDELAHLVLLVLLARVHVLPPHLGPAQATADVGHDVRASHQLPRLGPPHPDVGQVAGVEVVVAVVTVAAGAGLAGAAPAPPAGAVLLALLVAVGRRHQVGPPVAPREALAHDLRHEGEVGRTAQAAQRVGLGAREPRDRGAGPTFAGGTPVDLFFVAVVVEADVAAGSRGADDGGGDGGGGGGGGCGCGGGFALGRVVGMEGWGADRGGDGRRYRGADGGRDGAAIRGGRRGSRHGRGGDLSSPEGHLECREEKGRENRAGSRRLRHDATSCGRPPLRG